MVLQPISNGTYLVIGQCLVHAISYGEAFLGTLPENIRFVRKNTSCGIEAWHVKDDASGEVSMCDPRLHSLPLSVSAVDVMKGGLLKIDKQNLKKVGIKILILL